MATRRSSFDAHSVLAFSVPAPAFVLRRSRSHSLRVPPSSVFTLSRENVPRRCPLRSRPRALGRAHLSMSTVLAFRPTRATLHRLTVYGLANSCHVSTRAGDDHLLFEDRAFTSHPANRARPRLSTPAFALPYSTTFRVRLSAFTPRSRRTLTRFEPAHLATSMLETSHRCACVHLSFWTDSRSQPKPRRSLRTLRCVPTASSPALRSTCISRRSRSAGTSVLTFAHVFVFPRPRTCPVTSFDVEHLSSSSPFRSQSSRDAA
jgi:hypothetical protein